MARLIKTRNATDPATGKTIQHVLYDEGHVYVIYRWEEATDTNRVVEEIAYEGHADRKAARAMAMGALDSLHQQTLHDIHGDSYTDKRGIKLYWAENMGRYVTIPENDE
jgi:hypothetical protein